MRIKLPLVLFLHLHFFLLHAVDTCWSPSQQTVPHGSFSLNHMVSRIFLARIWKWSPWMRISKSLPSTSPATLIGSEEGVWPRLVQLNLGTFAGNVFFCCIRAQGTLSSDLLHSGGQPCLQIKLIPQKAVQRHWKNWCSWWPCYIGSFQLC